MDHLVIIMFGAFALFSFILNIGGLMHIVPLYFTAPILFFSLFIFLIYLNNRKNFRGF
jgi:hypothetical protein